MDTITKQVQTAYDQIAPAYARHIPGKPPANLINLGQRLLQYTGPGGHLLDIGCGPGYHLAWFEAQGARVTGIDLAAGMLTIARRATGGPLLMMDMRALAFQSASFDGAWCCASLLHLPKSEAPQVLRAIRRVLKPGGMLILSIQEGDFEGWNGGYVEEVMRFFARYTTEEMRALLLDCGFTVVATEREQTKKRTWLAFQCVAG